MDQKRRLKRIIDSSYKSLDELNKIIVQTIDLDELDPEKAKIAAAGKRQAIEDSIWISEKISELEELLNPESKKEEKTNTFFGVENKIS